VIPIKKI